MASETRSPDTETPGIPAWIVDVGEADFEREVLERSDRVPVVVDFWAPWCQPCRMLAPILERLAEEHAGAFVLARINVDEAPALAQAAGVRSIPSVRVIRGRAVVTGFEGAQPESVVRSVLAAVLPSAADEAAQAGETAAAAGDTARAEACWRAALAEDPRHPAALLGLARLHAARGERESALELLERIGPGTAVSKEAERLAASLRMASAAPAEEEPLRARLASHPDDLAARLALGRALAARGAHAEALDMLLEVVRRDPAYEEEAARRAMLDLFAVLGPDHELTQRYRAALARTLFR